MYALLIPAASGYERCSETADQSGSRLTPKLLGRRSECEALNQLAADALAGQSRVTVLRGEAGVAKGTQIVRDELTGAR
jgi:hypothetical protein